MSLTQEQKQHIATCLRFVAQASLLCNEGEEQASSMIAHIMRKMCDPDEGLKRVLSSEAHVIMKEKVKEEAMLEILNIQGTQKNTCNLEDQTTQISDAISKAWDRTAPKLNRQKIQDQLICAKWEDVTLETSIHTTMKNYCNSSAVEGMRQLMPYFECRFDQMLEGDAMLHYHQIVNNRVYYFQKAIIRNILTEIYNIRMTDIVKRVLKSEKTDTTKKELQNKQPVLKVLGQSKNDIKIDLMQFPLTHHQDHLEHLKIAVGTLTDVPRFFRMRLLRNLIYTAQHEITNGTGMDRLLEQVFHVTRMRLLRQLEDVWSLMEDHIVKEGQIALIEWKKKREEAKNTEIKLLCLGLRRLPDFPLRRPKERTRLSELD